METAATLLDAWMPRWDVADRHEVTVAASADRTYRAVRSVDMAAAPLARLLYAIRGFALRPTRVTATFDDILRSGFVLLAEQPGVEIVVGVGGRFWTLSGGKDRLTAERFGPYATPGSAKAAMSFRVDPLGDQLSRVVTETRVLCSDAAARRSFLRYWWLIHPGSALIRRLALGQIRRAAESPTRP